MKSIHIALIILVLILTSACRKVEKRDESGSQQDVSEQSSVQEGEKSIKQLKEELTKKGFSTFDYVDTKTGDTILMQQYFIAFLKRGPNRSQSKEEADSLQSLHMAHLGRMYTEGFADISGPFGDDGDMRGITIYNVPTLKMADSLANSDPMVKSGRLIIEMHPWWAGKGLPLR